MIRSDARFPTDPALVAQARSILGERAHLRFIVGGAGTGKSTVSAEIGRRLGIEVLDMDARLYGSWHGLFDPVRHPADHAWSTAPDPLAWQLALDAHEFVEFHAAATAEALDLLAAELGDRDPAEPLLVDGGIARPLVLARVVPPRVVACLTLPAAARAAVWTDSAERREFLGIVASVPATGDPVAAFLALDERLHVQIERDARRAGIRVFEREEGIALGAFADRIVAGLGIAPR